MSISISMYYFRLSIYLSIYLSSYICSRIKIYPDLSICIHIHIHICHRAGANPDHRGPGKLQFACAAVFVVERVLLRVKIFHLFIISRTWLGVRCVVKTRTSDIYL